MKLSWFFVLLLIAVVAVFSVQNAEPITVHILPWQITMSAALVIQLAAVLGAIAGITVGLRARRTSKLAALPSTALKDSGAKAKPNEHSAPTIMPTYVPPIP